MSVAAVERAHGRNRQRASTTGGALSWGNFSGQLVNEAATLVQMEQRLAARRVNQDPEADQMQKTKKRKRLEDDASHRPKSLRVDLDTKCPSPLEIFRLEQMREKSHGFGCSS